MRLFYWYPPKWPPWRHVQWTICTRTQQFKMNLGQNIWLSTYQPAVTSGPKVSVMSHSILIIVLWKPISLYIDYDESEWVILTFLSCQKVNLIELNPSATEATIQFLHSYNLQGI
jgi:hypothetical protein